MVVEKGYYTTSWDCINSAGVHQPSCGQKRGCATVLAVPITWPTKKGCTRYVLCMG